MLSGRMVPPVHLTRVSATFLHPTTRRPDPTLAMLEAGVFTGQADVTNPDSMHWFSTIPLLGGAPVESLVYAVGFDRAAGPDIHAVYVGGLANVLAAIPTSVTRAIYISTTGVYGDAAGDWVDESTPPDPQREGGRASFAAEQVLAAHPLGRRSAILRLAGLYGPGRIPYLAQLKADEPIAAPRDGWLNLIHVDDAAAVVLAADRWLAARTSFDGPHTFCVSDGTPVVRGDYYGEVARLLGPPPPRFVPPPADSPALARAGASRRVSNRKLLETLGVKLAYPSYSAGLAAILGTVENESR